MVVLSTRSRAELVQFHHDFFAVASTCEIRRQQGRRLARPKLSADCWQRETRNDEAEKKSQPMPTKQFHRILRLGH